MYLIRSVSKTLYVGLLILMFNFKGLDYVYWQKNSNKDLKFNVFNKMEDIIEVDFFYLLLFSLSVCLFLIYLIMCF